MLLLVFAIIAFFLIISGLLVSLVTKATVFGLIFVLILLPRLRVLINHVTLLWLVSFCCFLIVKRSLKLLCSEFAIFIPRRILFPNLLILLIDRFGCSSSFILISYEL